MERESILFVRIFLSAFINGLVKAAVTLCAEAAIIKSGISVAPCANSLGGNVAFFWADVQG